MRDGKDCWVVCREAENSTAKDGRERESLLFPRENRPVAALGIRYGLSCHGVCLSPKKSTSTCATEYRHCCYDAGEEKFMKLLDSSWICFLYGNCKKKKKKRVPYNILVVHKSVRSKRTLAISKYTLSKRHEEMEMR